VYGSNIVKRPIGVAFLGADSTGKTTMLRSLQDRYAEKLNFLSEIARPVIIAGYPLGKDASTESYIELTRRYLMALEEVIRDEKPFVSDRTLFDPFCYAVVNRTLPRPQIKPEFIQYLEAHWRMDSHNYSNYLYFPVEFSMTTDGVRVPDEDYRQKVDNTMQEYLYSSEKPHLHITGTHDQRLAKVVEFLDPLIDGT